MKSVKDVKSFVEQHDLAGEDFSFGKAFGLEASDEEKLGEPIDKSMAAIRAKRLNQKKGYIGTAIVILEEVLLIKDYSASQLFRLSVAMYHLDQIDKEVFIKKTFGEGAVKRSKRG
jgi:hypothetical protein